MNNQNTLAQSHSCVSGTRMSLDERTPLGLFECDNGNRFVVVDNADFNAVIALVHDEYLPFTWLALGTGTIEQGKWLGPLQLRLTHIAKKPEQIGTLGVGDGTAILSCRSQDGSQNWMPLGNVSAAGFEFADYDGWAIEACGSHRTFFEASPWSHRVLGYLSVT